VSPFVALKSASKETKSSVRLSFGAVNP